MEELNRFFGVSAESPAKLVLTTASDNGKNIGVDPQLAVAGEKTNGDQAESPAKLVLASARGNVEDLE